MDRVLGEGDRRGVHDEGVPVGLPGRAGEDLHHVVPLLRERGVVGPRRELRSPLLLPGGQEQPLELRHRRPLNPHVGVAPLDGCRMVRPRIGGAGRVDPRDVDAPREGDLAVDDQDLAVVPGEEVPFPVAMEGIGAIELHHLDARVLQPLEEGGARGGTPHAVVDEVHLDALCSLPRERLREPPPDLVVLDDVGLEVDMVAGVVDGLEHRVVGGRTVDEQRDLVALRERRVAHRLGHGGQALQQVGGLARPLEPRQDRPALLGGEEPFGGDDGGPLRGRRRCGHHPGGVGQRGAAAGEPGEPGQVNRQDAGGRGSRPTRPLRPAHAAPALSR